jgi:hypothetical protein
MVNFSKTGNVVKVDLSGETYFVPADIPVFAVNGRIHLGSPPGNTKSYSKIWSFLATEINGRPSDDINDVAEWLAITYFNGIAGGSGGGGGTGDATAANQITQINKLTAIEADIEAFASKTESGMVTVPHDNIVIGYNVNGTINYVAYRNGSTEVARKTFSYDGNDNITGFALS